jgi:NAD(P)H-dependent FMN reductase
LQIIIGSTRPGRTGPAIADWIYQRAIAHGGFNVELIDLAEVQLPMFDEPKHPRFGEYEHQHTRDWSATISRADAFIVVMPEYNFGFTAPVKNAIDYLHREWRGKAVGFVSYGGVAAGTRAVQMLKPVLTTLKMVPITESVSIPFVNRLLDSGGRLQPSEMMDQAATAMLDELATWTAVLEPIREPAVVPAG